MEVKWIKICTDIFDDEKIRLIEAMPEADSIIVIWFKLLCLAGKQNNNGIFMLTDKIAYTDEMLATIFRRSLPTVRLALNTFDKFGMVELVENVVTIPNWTKHQSLDELKRKKEQVKERVNRYRAKQREIEKCNAPVTVTSVTCNAIDKDIDIDIDKDIEREEEKKPTLQNFLQRCNVEMTNYNPSSLERMDFSDLIEAYNNSRYLREDKAPRWFSFWERHYGEIIGGKYEDNEERKDKEDSVIAQRERLLKQLGGKNEN